MIFQPSDPFPDPVHAGQEIENIGIMFGAIIVILLLLFLMIYFYSKKRYFLPILVVFLFSLIIGMLSMEFGIPFTPYVQIFFMLMQSVFFIMTAIQLIIK